MDSHLKTFHKIPNNQSTNSKISNEHSENTGDGTLPRLNSNSGILRSVKIDYDDFSESEDLMNGIDVNPNEDESKAWYREEELHATEEDLKELEAKEHSCAICKLQFSSSTNLLEHTLTCGTSLPNG